MPSHGGIDLIKILVSKKLYRYSSKVESFLEDGYYTTEDIELCIETGSVYKVERDEQKNSIGNKKYVIKGKDTCGNDFYTAGKIINCDGGRVYFLITAHQ